ncbi:hypothetical protein [Oceanobacillus salinisoli]|uniref:hypothetical protein n=1 Tax=Oceanobacillus salinisoli TaxID=2678611 RepID=UPI001E53B34D|nr:hypothetical protein [Oceanobacillus salinisoli]
MPIKVLAVGPKDLKNLVLEVGQEYPEITIHYVTYNSENEVIHLVKQHEQENLQEDIDNMVNFHYKLWKNNQINVAITCIGSVYEKLKEKGVPTSRIIPTRSSVRSSMQHVLLEGKNLRQLNYKLP